MINCDYDFGFSINREKLYEDLVEADYFTTFSPDGYPGVNSKYMHNTNNKMVFAFLKICVMVRVVVVVMVNVGELRWQYFRVVKC